MRNCTRNLPMQMILKADLNVQQAHICTLSLIGYDLFPFNSNINTLKIPSKGTTTFDRMTTNRITVSFFRDIY